MNIPKNLNMDMKNRYGVIKYVNLNEPYKNFRGVKYLVERKK